jgi:fatty acid desaturase
VLVLVVLVLALVVLVLALVVLVLALVGLVLALVVLVQVVVGYIIFPIEVECSYHQHHCESNQESYSYPYKQEDRVAKL